jgi:hypothetical protein
MNRLLTWAAALAMCFSDSAGADCVINAKLKQKFVILDAHTVVLTGGIGPDILIKTFAFFTGRPNLTVLKDSFCSYESAVLYVDGEVVDAQEVKDLR